MCQSSGYLQSLYHNHLGQTASPSFFNLTFIFWQQSQFISSGPVDVSLPKLCVQQLL